MTITSAYLIRASNRKNLAYAVGTVLLLTPDGSEPKWFPSAENASTGIVFSYDTTASPPDLTFSQLAALITENTGTEEYKLKPTNKDVDLPSRFMTLII